MILGRLKPKAANPPPAFEETPPAAPDAATAAGGPNAKLESTNTPLHPGSLRQPSLSHAFAQVVAVMMRDASSRKLPLADLEWLVLPPLLAGQFRLAQIPQQAKSETQPGMLVPVAVALWACVSPDIDKALSDNPGEAVRLKANDWASGDRIWLMAAAGDPRAMPAFLQQLQKTEFKGREVKFRKRGADGKVVVGTLSAET